MHRTDADQSIPSEHSDAELLEIADPSSKDLTMLSNGSPADPAPPSVEKDEQKPSKVSLREWTRHYDPPKGIHISQSPGGTVSIVPDLDQIKSMTQDLEGTVTIETKEGLTVRKEKTGTVFVTSDNGTTAQTPGGTFSFKLIERGIKQEGIKFSNGTLIFSPKDLDDITQVGPPSRIHLSNPEKTRKKTLARTAQEQQASIGLKFQFSNNDKKNTGKREDERVGKRVGDDPEWSQPLERISARSTLPNGKRRT